MTINTSLIETMILEDDAATALMPGLPVMGWAGGLAGWLPW